jgi:hypothetical protein
MSFMGSAFKAPKQQDIKQWGKVAMLVRSGFRFHPNYARVPHTIREASEFIAKRQLRTPGAKLLERILRRKPKAKE